MVQIHGLSSGQFVRLVYRRAVKDESRVLRPWLDAFLMMSSAGDVGPAGDLSAR